jgi:predicted GIY-YIG superfamily endonuclease/predicted GNAT family acetyltransferase
VKKNFSTVTDENKKPWWVYIAECSDGTYYTGISNDINKRLDKHNTGCGAQYTKNRNPVSLVYFEKHLNRSLATKREYQIKQLTRQEKEKLVDAFLSNMVGLKENCLSISKMPADSFGLKIIIANQENQELARAFLYIMQNDLHERPFALLEDVFVESENRGQGLGTQLIKKAISEAKRLNCYKLIATSRYQRRKVHELYLNLGFKDWGQEFRLDF